MKQIKTFLLLTLTTLLLNPVISHSQPISKNNIDKAITKMAGLIESNYVFVQKGNKIALKLLEGYKNGKFNNVSSWKEFDSLITKHLQEISHDGHLYAKYDPITVKELIENKPESGDGSASDSLAIANNYGFQEVKILEGNIGYLKINEININEKSLPILFSAIQFISNTKGLIINLQNNGGGGSEVGPILESIFLAKNTQLLEFRRRNGQSSIAKTVEWIPVKTYDKPLYILVNKKTGSAAEYFAFVMQYLKRATIVGQTSYGAANMNSWYPVNDEIYLSVSTASPTIPNTEISWEQVGVKPDIFIEPGNEIKKIIELVNNKK